MKNIKIKEMTLSNFKGQNAHYEFGENINEILGKNGYGKTTVIKAWNWLLCGQSDANTVANDNLFDNRKPITPETPTASVDVTISIDGCEYKLKRTATAAFTRKRGTQEMIKSASDAYKYYIDNIEYNATEYREWLSTNIAPDDMLRFALSGDFFVNLVVSDKKRARTIIEKTIGSVDRSEMKGDYSLIDELLTKYTPDQIEEQAKNLSKSVDERLNTIPSIISLKENETSEIQRTDFVALQKEIDELEAKHRSIEEQIFDYSARIKPQLEAKAKAERDKQMKQEVYDKAKKVYMQGLIEEDNNLCLEISRIEKENADKKSRIAELRKMNEIDNEVKEQYEQKIGELRKKAEEIRTMDYDGDYVCPICGQPLPNSKKAEVIIQFEESRKLKFDTVIAEGKEIAGYIDNIINNIKKRNDEIDSIAFGDVEPLKQKLNELRTDDNIVPFELTEQGKTLQSDIDAVVIPEVKMPEDGELRTKLAEINSRLKTLYSLKGAEKRLQSLKKDIDDLRSEQREKGAELAKYEQQRYLVKEYKQEQMQILSDKVNRGLMFSRLEIWSQQKDGSCVPDMVIKNKDGVSFATANNASRLVTIIDIQRFFCERLDVNMPVFLDEASTIDTENIPHYDNTQMFLLFRADTPLTIKNRKQTLKPQEDLYINKKKIIGSNPSKKD